MNIEINLLPKELRARPLVDLRTALLVVLILALGYGCYFFISGKSDVQAENTDIEARTVAIRQETTAVLNNPEALALQNSIAQLTLAKQSYESFVNSQMAWGDALASVYASVPTGVRIDTITQSGNNLVIVVTSSSYTAVADYGLALNNNGRFTLFAIPTFDSAEATATLRISVAPGGAL